VEMSLNGSGVRDIARVLHVSPSTVIRELKKRSRTCKRSIRNCGMVQNWDFRVTRRDKLGHHSDDDLEPSLHFWLGLLEALKS
jgi:IS30 family transposase